MHQNIMWSYYIKKVKEKELEKIKDDIKDNMIKSTTPLSVECENDINRLVRGFQGYIK